MTTYLYGCRGSVENFAPFDGQADAVLFIDEPDDADLPFLDRPKAGEMDRTLRAGDTVLLFADEVEEEGEIDVLVRWERRGVTCDFLRLSFKRLPPEQLESIQWDLAGSL
jgi:hypothetical protein